MYDPFHEDVLRTFKPFFESNAQNFFLRVLGFNQYFARRLLRNFTYPIDFQSFLSG